MTSTDLENAVDEIITLANRKRRDGGLGPLMRAKLTRQRARNAISAVEEDGGVSALRGMSANQQAVERTGIEKRALKRAVEMEAEREARPGEGYGSFIALIAMLLPLLQPLLEWLITAWINKKLAT